MKTNKQNPLGHFTFSVFKKSITLTTKNKHKKNTQNNQNLAGEGSHQSFSASQSWKAAARSPICSVRRKLAAQSWFLVKRAAQPPALTAVICRRLTVKQGVFKQHTVMPFYLFMYLFLKECLMYVMLASTHYTGEGDDLDPPVSTLRTGIPGIFLNAWFM